MSFDMKCVVCGEPWDSYGVSHGDMLPWEAKLFRAGAGCPSCEGVSNGWKPETLSDVENGDDDPMLRIIAAERAADGTAPKWERPTDPTLWTCAACHVSVKRDVDDGEPYWSKAHRFDPTEEPAHRFTDETPVCEECLEHCSECGTELCSALSGDTYDGLASFPSPADEYHDVVCVDCLDKVQEEEAQRVWADCYNASERVAYIRKHRSQFDFRNFADMIGCVRGRYFAGYASELLY